MEVLRKLRKEKGETQQQIASMLGITQQAYAAYENETAHPPIHILKFLSEHFNVTIDYLVGVSNDGVYVPPILRDAKFAFNGDSRLTQDKIDEITRFAEYILAKDDGKK